MGHGKIMKMCMRFDISATAKGDNCVVVEWVKYHTLKWFGHVRRINDGEFVKIMYEGGLEDGGVWRPPVKWLN